MDELTPKTIKVLVQKYGFSHVVRLEQLESLGIEEILEHVRQSLLHWAEREHVNLIPDTEHIEVEARITARGVQCPEEIDWERFKTHRLHPFLPAFSFYTNDEGEI